MDVYILPVFVEVIVRMADVVVGKAAEESKRILLLQSSTDDHPDRLQVLAGVTVLDCAVSKLYLCILLKIEVQIPDPIPQVCSYAKHDHIVLL